MMVNWQRPENVPYPSVWLTFHAKDCDSDKIVKYRVQDLPEDRFDEVVKHMTTFFLADEALCVLKGFQHCTESVAEARKIWIDCMKLKLTLACFKDDSDELVAVNIIVTEHVCEKAPPPKSTIFRQVFDVLAYISTRVNIFEKFNTDVYMAGFGLSVAPKYHRRGIAQQMLAARVPLGRAVGLTCTSTGFTSIAAQKAAARAGFEEIYECTPDELKLNGMDFLGIEPIKLMTLKLS